MGALAAALGAAVALAAFTAAPAGAATATITSTPANGTHYVAGEAITTRISNFGSLQGVGPGGFPNNRMSIDIGGTTRQARVTTTFSVGLTVVDFSYTVTRDDFDTDGITVPANSISGPVWSFSLDRSHSALTNQASHKVIGSSAAVSSPSPARLAPGSPLNGATLGLSLTGTTFGSGVTASHFSVAATPPIAGLSVSGVSGAASGGTTATLTLSYGGPGFDDERTLVVTVAAAAHAGTVDLTTGTVTVAGAASAAVDSKARSKAVNEAILPELARASWGSVLDAVTGRMTSPGAGEAAAAGGGLATAAAEALRANERALEDGSASWKDLLGGGSFAFSLGAGAGADGATGGRGATVWGAGEWRDLSRDERARDWSGDLFAAHLGVDVAARADLRAGLMGSWFSSDVDYTDRSGGGAVDGSHESRMTVLSPWLGWDAGGGTRLWGALGFGRGEIEMTDEALRAGEGKQSADSRLLAMGAGGARRLWSEDALTLDAKGSLEAARYEVKGNGEAIEGLTVTTRRVRVGAEVARVYALGGDATLTPTFEVGARGDDGDGATGAGLEAGGGLAWADPSRGLALEARGRALVAHRRDLDDWSVSGALRVDPGAAGRGLSLNVQPSWGTAGSGGAARRWEEGMAGRGAVDEPLGAGLRSELGYGLPAFGGVGAATPYTRFGLEQEEQRYGLGWRLDRPADAFALDLEAWRRERGRDRPEHGVTVTLRAMQW